MPPKRRKQSVESPQRVASPSNSARPFISADNFEYFSWANRWFYQHILPDADEQAGSSQRVTKPPKPAPTQNTGVNGQSNNTCRPTLNRVTVPELKPQTLNGVLRDVAKSKLSSLSCSEHIQYVQLCLKYFRKGFIPKMTGQETSFYQMLHKRVCAEQTKFLTKAKEVVAIHYPLYEYLHSDADRYVKDLLKNHFLRVYKYPRHYEPKDALPLIGTTPSVHFRHLATLLDMGSFPRVLLPTLKTKSKTPCSYEKVSYRYPVGYEVCARDKKVLHKVPVSQDPNAEALARKHGATVVVSSSGLKRLADNFAPEYGDSWTIPIVVRHYSTDSGGKDVVVYLDKPLPPIQMSAQERNRWFHKYSLKTLVLHPHFKKPVNRDYVTTIENDDYLKCDSDLTDLEVFGVPHKENMCKDLKKPSFVNKAVENPAASTQLSFDDTTKTECSISKSDVVAKKSEIQHIKDEMRIMNSEESSSEAENLVIDECRPQNDSTHIQDTKALTTMESPTCNISESASPRSTCSSDALYIDESYASSNLQTSPLSSPQSGSGFGVTASDESDAKQRRAKLTSSVITRASKTKATSAKKDVAPVTSAKQVPVVGSPVTQNTGNSNTSETYQINKLPEISPGMVTRSKSKSALEMKTPEHQINVRKRQKRQDVNNVPEVHSDNQIMLEPSSTPSNTTSKSAMSEKKLLEDVFGGSSSEDETSPDRVNNNQPKRASRKPLNTRTSLKTMIRPLMDKQTKDTSGEDDANPLSRILADQERMFQAAGKIHPASSISANEESSSSAVFGRENPEDYTPCAKDKHVAYRLFSLGNMQILVRGSVHGKTESKVKRRFPGRQYTIFPKLEYKSYCGGEVLTHSEEVRQAVSALIHPQSAVLQVRIDAFTSEILEVETRELAEYSIMSQRAVDLIHTLLQKLPFLPAGNYILTHKKTEGFANILKEADAFKQGAYDLHGAYSYILSEQPPLITVAPWLPINPKIFFKHHQQHIPATFQPFAVKPLGFRKKLKKKKYQKNRKNQGQPRLTPGINHKRNCC